MKKFKFKSLTIRIWMVFTITITIFILCIFAIYSFLSNSSQDNYKEEYLKIGHEMLLKENRNETNLNGIKSYKNLIGIRDFIVTIDINGEINIKNINFPTEKRLLVDEEIKLWISKYLEREGDVQNKEFTKKYKGRKVNFIATSIENNDLNRSYLISYIIGKKAYIKFSDILILIAIFIVLGYVTSRIISRYIANPLRELEEYTVDISNKKWRDPIYVKSEDEIGRLVKSMNKMQRKLKRADEEEKVFLQSISHDLKTPVMVIMSHAQSIIDGIYVHSPEETSEIIKNEAIRLDKKINQILYLNTLNYALENNQEEERIDISKLIQDTVDRFEMINNKLNWSVDCEQIFINSNKEKIQVVIDNIIDNQIRYAKSEIKIIIKENDKYIDINIYNDGPSIDENEIGKIFNNLYKGKRGNFGLGLAICKKIIEFYNGDIRVINHKKGVSFIIKYPK